MVQWVSSQKIGNLVALVDTSYVSGTNFTEYGSHIHHDIDSKTIRIIYMRFAEKCWV